MPNCLLFVSVTQTKNVYASDGKDRRLNGVPREKMLLYAHPQCEEQFFLHKRKLIVTCIQLELTPPFAIHPLAFLAHIVKAPGQLADGWPHHLQPRFIGARIDRSKWHFVDHHLNHAASAFHVSPFSDAAVLTIDGRGEKATTGYYIGSGKQPYVYWPGEHAAFIGTVVRTHDNKSGTFRFFG